MLISNKAKEKLIIPARNSQFSFPNLTITLLTIFLYVPYYLFSPFSYFFMFTIPLHILLPFLMWQRRVGNMCLQQYAQYKCLHVGHGAATGRLKQLLAMTSIFVFNSVYSVSHGSCLLFFSEFSYFYKYF